MFKLPNVFKTKDRMTISEFMNMTKKSSKFKKVLITSIGITLFISNKVSARPSTGFAPMDDGAWQLVKIMQAAIFWVALIYTLKSLFEFATKGEGDWKNISTGFLICIADYMVPWVFGLIPTMFKF